MNEWHTAKLGQIVDVLDSRRRPINSDERAKRIGDVPYYGANGQQGWIDEPLFDEPLILLAEDGGNFDDFSDRPIAYRISGPSWVNNHAHIIRASRGVDQSFLFWSLVHRDIRRYISGGTRSKLTQAEMRSIEIEMPGLPQQRRIAEILDGVEEKVQVTKRIAAKLRLAKHGLVSDLLSGDWPMTRLGELSNLITSGSRGWARYYSEDGANFIRIGNLTRDHINLRFDSLVRVRVPSDGEGSRTSLLPGDLLISITADLGIIGVVPSSLGESYINQHVALVRLNNAEKYSRWVGHYLNSPAGQSQFARLNDMGAKSGLNLPTIANLEIPIPETPERVNAVAVLDALDERIAQTLRELEKLSKQKHGIMADLLTGRVGVPVGAAS